MTQEHEPSPDFARFLEWQTRTELRRNARFQPAARSVWMARAARVAAIVLVSVLSGAGIVIASQSVQESRAFDLLLERNQILLDLSERRVAAAVKASERERLMVESGVASQGRLDDAVTRHAELERVRDHHQLDRVELLGTRRAVNRALTAPLVGVRDFAVEHLRIDRAVLDRAVTILERKEEHKRLLYEHGLLDGAGMLEATQATELARADLVGMDARIALRNEFLAGDVSALECETRELVLDAEHRRARVQVQIGQLEKALARARAMEQAGRGSGDVARLEPELDTARTELELIELELEYLK